MDSEVTTNGTYGDVVHIDGDVVDAFLRQITITLTHLQTGQRRTTQPLGMHWTENKLSVQYHDLNQIDDENRAHQSYVLISRASDGSLEQTGVVTLWNNPQQ